MIERRMNALPLQMDLAFQNRKQMLSECQERHCNLMLHALCRAMEVASGYGPSPLAPVQHTVELGFTGVEPKLM